MFEFLKQAIVSHMYTDLNAMTAKVDKAWAMSAITDNERSELLAMLRAEQPRYDLDVQDEIAKLWAAVKEIRQRLASVPDSTPGSGEGSTEASEWVQPTGAHDAYNAGDRVLYNGSVYESTIDGNVWSPLVYPDGWELIEAEQSEGE